MDRKTLYHKGKQGELRIWSVWTEDDQIKTEYGVLNGEMQVSVKKATPKNVGRSNETTAAQQADLEAQSLYQFKLDRKYSTTQESAQEPLLLPMLAKDDLKKLAFPCYVQPKLDGVRCLAFWDGDRIKLISRAGKEWTVPKHINEQVAKVLPKDSMFDGELYIHGKSCQTITSYVKKWRDVETPTVEYHIYDMPILQGRDDDSFEVRMSHLGYLLNSHPLRACPPNLKYVQTLRANSLEEVKEFEGQCVKEGYEGAIARNKDGLYVFGYRSNDLIKIKTFQDAEFEVTGCRDGVGKFEGCAVFICKNDKNDLTFECTLAVSMEERARLYREQAKYIGKKLTVKFFDRTDDELPRFPVGKMFRDEKDLSQ
jgi:ATP-dependent DNA ligase